MNAGVKNKLRHFLLSDKFTAAHMIIQPLTMFCWLIILLYTKAYYVIYLLIGVLGFLARNMTNHDKKSIFSKSERINLIVSACFSGLSMMSNYDIYSLMIRSIRNNIWTPSTINNIDHYFSELCIGFTVICSPLLFLGGLYITYFILKYVTDNLTAFQWSKSICNLKARTVFKIVFTALSVVRLAVLLICFYPGILSPDSISQISQCFSHSYSNSHPIFHTMLIRFFVMLGMNIFDDINLGVAFYCIFSIMLMSAAFAYAVVTLYQLKVNFKIIILVVMVYFFHPCHILYSFIVWKDIPFSAAVLLFTVSVFRYIKEISHNRTINQIMIVVSSFGICMFRGNGLIVLFVIILSFLFLFKKNYRKLLISFACVLALSLIITYPVLRVLHIEQSDSVELLSIPIQQIGRTINEEKELTESQIRMISKVVDVDEVKSTYKPNISDPLKNLIREKGDREYLNKHMAEYVFLYFQIGLRHPGSYIRGWTDQTKGYWNAGYYYSLFSYVVSNNNLGIKRTVLSEPIRFICCCYFDMWEYFDLTKPFISIGIHTWLILLAVFIGYRKKDKLVVFLTVPCLAIIFTLLIGTPVYAEFRYAYALFCCLPFLAVIAFCNAPAKLKSDELSLKQKY